MEFDIVESWDGLKWAIRHGKRYEHDKAVLSKGELCVLRALTTLASRDKTFADVGSHVGYYTCRMAKLYRHVYAFEPNPETRENLQRNISLNNLDNVTVYPYALGDKEEVKKLHMASASSTLLDGYPSWGTVDVEVKRMDTLIDTVDVVKIDVEGYELNVLRGMKRIIDTCKPSLVIEHHEFRFYRINTYPVIRKMLTDMGYVMIFLSEPHRLYYHRSRGMDAVRDLIADHWINYCILNLRQGRDWYHGLPYTWWWGMNLVDFIHEIRNHIDEEPLWVDLITKHDF